VLADRESAAVAESHSWYEYMYLVGLLLYMYLVGLLLHPRTFPSVYAALAR